MTASNYSKHMKNQILPLLCILFYSTVCGAKETCSIRVTASEGTHPIELVIKPSGQDPQNSNYRTSLAEGSYQCRIETDEIELYEITDLGEILEKGSTRRFGSFLIEDGADIKITIDGDKINIVSTGPEFSKWEKMLKSAGEKFDPEFATIKNIKDPNEAEKKEEELYNAYSKWTLDYYANNPMIYFMLELSSDLSSFRHETHSYSDRLDLYHNKYESLYPGHSVHKQIADAESKGYQIFGRKYNDYKVRTLSGEIVNGSSYIGEGYTLVVCWATWCAPCRKEACGIIPLYEKYKDRGLTVFSLAREFKSTDNLKSAIEKDRYPWETLVDLDDEFKVFEQHGATSSALFLLDPDHKIIATPFSVEELDATLQEYLGQ